MDKHIWRRDFSRVNSNGFYKGHLDYKINITGTGRKKQLRAKKQKKCLKDENVHGAA